MNTKFSICLTLLLLIIYSTNTYAQYKVLHSSFSNGAVYTASNSNHKLNSIAGQGLTGVSYNSNYFANSGFIYISRPVITGVDDFLTGLPETFELYQNYPNPFNPATTIKYALPEAAKVKIDVYNVLGQQLATLVNTNMPAGFHLVNFEAGSFPSGLYFYTIQAGSYSKVLKMMLVK